MDVKNKILNTSLDLFTDYGMQGTSTKLITEKAKISNGALFHYFQNKDEILLVLFKQIKLEVLDYVYDKVISYSTTINFVKQFYSANILWGIKNPKKKLFLNMFSHHPKVREYINFDNIDGYMIINNFIIDSINTNIIVSKNINIFYYIFSGHCNGVIEYLTQFPNEDVDKIIEHSFCSFWRGISGNKE